MDPVQINPPDAVKPPRSLEELEAASKKKASVVSILVHVAFILVAGTIVAMTIKEQPQADFIAPDPPRPRLEPRKLEMKVRVNQLNKRSARPKLQPRMLAMAPSDLALPEIKKNPEAVKQKVKRNFSTLGMAGSGLGVGGGHGTGMGGGIGGMGLPPTMADRCSAQNRSTRLRRTGGRAASDQAVVRALDWLQGQQNPDGSWGTAHPVAMTGLALLAYLGHCETPDSPAYGSTVQKAIDYLVSRGGGDLIASGGGSGRAYEHGIATYALGEAYILTGDPAIRDTFVKGVLRIIRGQNNDGGWVYSMGGGSAGPSDTSVSGWQIQALKSAYLAGLEGVDGIEASLDLAMTNLKRVYGRELGNFGYRGPDTTHRNLTGVGVLGLTMWKNSQSPEAKGGIKFIMELVENAKDKERRLVYNSMNVYRTYYDVQAVFSVGGSTWKKYNDWFQTPLIDAQNPDGSWPPTGGNLQAGGDTTSDGNVYRTAMNTLMLEVYYRYLPTVDL